MFIRVLSLFLVLLVAGLARDVSDDRKTDGMMIGGLTPTKPANRQIQNMVEQVCSMFNIMYMEMNVHQSTAKILPGEGGHGMVLIK